MAVSGTTPTCSSRRARRWSSTLDVFAAVGGFDERYFMFFEDVDLGWRLWLLGYEVRYVPASLVYHRHHGSMTAVRPWREHYLLERNALFTIYKNYDDENLARLLPAALALAIRRGVARGGDDTHSLEVRDATSDEGHRESVSKHTLAGAYAVDGFVEGLDGLHRSRLELQGARRRGDHEILPLFRTPLLANGDDTGFLEGYRCVGGSFRCRRGVHPALQIVVDHRRHAAAGDGRARDPRVADRLRAVRASTKSCSSSTTKCSGLSHPDFQVRKVNDWQLRRLVKWCDIIVFQGYSMFEHPSIAHVGQDRRRRHLRPVPPRAARAGARPRPGARRNVVRSATEVLNEQLARGDLFLCASAKQRDFWLGQLAAVGRVNPLDLRRRRVARATSSRSCRSG